MHHLGVIKGKPVNCAESSRSAFGQYQKGCWDDQGSMEPAVGKERGRCWGQKRGEGAGEVGPGELGGKEVRGHIMVGRWGEVGPGRGQGTWLRGTIIIICLHRISSSSLVGSQCLQVCLCMVQPRQSPG